MKKLYKDIYDWIKNPDDTELLLGSAGKFQITCQILLLQFVLVVPFVGLIYLIHYHIIKLDLILHEWSFLETILAAVVVAPLLEEFFFRFPLKYRRNYLARFLNYISRGRVEKRWNSIFRYFLFLSAFAFGLIHLTNYTNTGIFFFALFPIIVGSQLIGGLLFSYSRIKFGIIWSVFQHGAFNFILIILGWITFHNQEIVNISNEDISIKITELEFVDGNGPSYATRSTTTFEKNLIHSVDGRNISLHGLIDSLGLEGPKPYDNTLINVEIYSQDGVTNSEIQNILKSQIRFD